MKKLLGLSIEVDIKNKFQSAVSLNGKKMSRVITDLMIGYIEESEKINEEKKQKEIQLKKNFGEIPKTKEELEEERLTEQELLNKKW